MTIWQPWASLVVMGAKRHEFRGWSFAAKPQLAPLIGERIVIHAGARPVRLNEVTDILTRLEDGTSGLIPEIAVPFLTNLADALRTGAEAQVRWKKETQSARALKRRREERFTQLTGEEFVIDIPPEPPSGQILYLAAGLGTVELGRPKPVAEIFPELADSDRLDHSKWGWPMIAPEAWLAPVPMRGLQGFWTWPEGSS